MDARAGGVGVAAALERKCADASAVKGDKNHRPREHHPAPKHGLSEHS
jgi:hypothetical protein